MGERNGRYFNIARRNVARWRRPRRQNQNRANLQMAGLLGSWESTDGNSRKKIPAVSLIVRCRHCLVCDAHQLSRTFKGACGSPNRYSGALRPPYTCRCENAPTMPPTGAHFAGESVIFRREINTPLNRAPRSSSADM